MKYLEKIIMDKVKEYLKYKQILIEKFKYIQMIMFPSIIDIINNKLINSL